MAALMINVEKEKRKQKKDKKKLLSLCMLMKAIYILYFVSANKSMREEKRKGGGGLQCCGTTFVMLNPIPNLPVLIGHHKHPFTKQRTVGELGDCAREEGGGRGSAGHSQMADTG